MGQYLIRFNKLIIKKDNYSINNTFVINNTLHILYYGLLS